MKRFAFLLCIIGSLNLSASHILGGEITWDCLGSGQYYMKLTLYRDCTGIGLNTSTQSISGPFGNIPLGRKSIETLNPICADPANSYGCPGDVTTFPPFLGSIERHVYADTISLSGTPPSSGWEFSYVYCCRDYLVNSSVGSGYYIHSTMFNDPSNGCSGSPTFLEITTVIDTGKFLYSNIAIAPMDFDSLYYSWIDPLISSSQTITWDSGYSADHPFPDSTENSLNKNTFFDPQVGYGYTNIKSLTNNQKGLYVYGVSVECWRNGHLISRVNRDMNLLITELNHIDNKPTLSFSNAVNPSQPIDNFTQISDGYYSLVLTACDTANINLSSSDFDFHFAGGGAMVPQVITFSARGQSLYSSHSDFLSKPSFLPVAPQSSFASTVSNNINFYWNLEPEHVQGRESEHYFSFSFIDDACPKPNEQNALLKVTVINPAHIAPDTIWACENDSITITGFTLSGDHVWLPNNDTVGTITFAADSSYFIHVYDPAFPCVKDSVYIQVSEKETFALDTLGGLIILTDSVQSVRKTWYYNGVSFVNPSDTLIPFGPGRYWVESIGVTCNYVSDTIEITSLYFSLADPGNGTLLNDPQVLAGSWTAGFNVDPNAAGTLQWLIIPGIMDLGESTAGYELSVELRDAKGTSLWKTDTSVENLNEELLTLPVGVVLYGTTNYEITVQGDTGYAFTMFTGVSVPATPWNNGMNLNSLTMDGQPADKLIPLVFGMINQVDLDGRAALSTISLYPNPVKGILSLEGVEPGTLVKLLDVSGKELRSVELGDELQIDLSDLPAGVYLVQVEGQVFRVRVL